VVEAELEVAQARHDELIELMAEPTLYADREAFDAAMAEYAELKSRLPGLEGEWIRLSEEIERLSEESAD